MKSKKKQKKIVKNEKDEQLRNQLLEKNKWSWNDRRELIEDIKNLADADIPGVLLILYSLYDCEVFEDIQEMEKNAVHMISYIDFNQLSHKSLFQLKKYVDACMFPCNRSFHGTYENCVICEGLWSSAPLITCGNDSCGLKIHESCFGVIVRSGSNGYVSVDEKHPWYCPSCLYGDQSLSCVVCLQEGGALKSTDDERWIHTLCALVIPETFMRDVPTLEPVEGVANINPSRFRFVCNVCKVRGGVCMTCEEDSCNIGAHPQCAADAGLLIGNENTKNPFGLYCEKHVVEFATVPGAKRFISEVDIDSEDILPISYSSTYIKTYADYFLDSYYVKFNKKERNDINTKSINLNIK